MAGKILITPNAGSTTVDPTIAFQGTGVTTDITLRVPSTGGLSFEGASGQLFSITDSMSGTIFSVNDISGIPSIEVLDTGLVKLAQYSGNVVLGSGTDNGTDKLQVAGTVTATNFSGSSSGANTGDETTATIKSKLGITTLSGANTGDNPGVTSVTTAGGYGGLTLTGGPITTTGTITLSGTPSGTWPITAASITSQANSATIAAATASTINTIAQRDSSGDISARLFRSEYDTTNPTVGLIMTQIDTVSNNYIRPTTPAQFRAAVTAGYYPSGSGTSTGTNTGDETTATIKSKLGITTLSGANTGDQTNITGNAATATRLPTAYIGGVQLNPQTYFNNSVGLRAAMTGAAGTWTDTLWINGYSGGDVPNMVAIHTSRQATPRMWLSTQSNLSTSYGTMHEVISSYNIASQTVSHAGTATTAYNLTGAIYGSSGTSYSAATQVREAGLAGAQGSAAAAAPRLAFHWSGVVASSISLNSAGDFFFDDNPGTGRANIHAGTATATTFNSLSDINFKDNIVPLAGSLDIIKQLNGYSFDWKDGSGSSYGVIAQEVEKIIPNAVTQGKDQKSVNYAAIVPFLIEAVKKQQATIELLESRINKLEASVNACN